jgi:predicted O-methyltransferase YrrM
MNITHIQQKITELEKTRTDWFVPKETMGFMTNLLHLFNAKSVLEIGTHHGFSALCFSLDTTKVVTIEKDEAWANIAHKNISVANNIELIQGDALVVLPTLQEQKKQFDFIFIDAKKCEYKEYVQLSLLLLSKEGGIFIDDTITQKHKMGNLFEYLENTTIYHKELGVGNGLLMITQNKEMIGAMQ